MTSLAKIKNFCIIAHIDHGKSTLADRFLEVTNTVPKRLMKNQLLDQMDLERERGITIKLQPVRMEYNGYILNLIDTPGHVDFTYEVSRSLAAVESAVLLVDATQGIEAQTIANLYLAMEQNLKIIPVINKIDLPAANVEAVKRDLINLLGVSEQEIISISAKTGQNVAKVLDQIIELTPSPETNFNQLQALIFDSNYDEYLGVVTYLRIFNGSVSAGDKILLTSSRQTAEVIEVGYLKPKREKATSLKSGEIGYLVTGLKELENFKVGDTVTLLADPGIALPGYKEVKPMVYAGIFCQEGDNFPLLRAALEKLKLNDASLSYIPENSPALGYGFRCGFLGLLHLEIINQRLIREYNLEVIITPPSVAYKVKLTSGKEIEVRSPEELPLPTSIAEVSEPIMTIDIVVPDTYLGVIMSLVQDSRGEYINTEYLENQRVILHYHIPLAMLLTDFYDKLKSVSAGYASLNYDFYKYSVTQVVKLDIYVAESMVEALSKIVYADQIQYLARKTVTALKESLPKQMFVVKIQAAVGGKIVASERLSAMRKDVTAKLYGGDVTRKRKLLEKQKKGKKKMLQQGRVEIPQEVFFQMLKK